jgi:hypothetical protein
MSHISKRPIKFLSSTSTTRFFFLFFKKKLTSAQGIVLLVKELNLLNKILKFV